MSRLHRFFTALGTFFLFTNLAPAQNMSASEVFQRCHLRLARSLPATNDPLLTAVKSGKKTAAQACADLLRTAELNSQGVMINRADARARMIMKTMHDFHRTYFQSRRNENLVTSSYLIRDGEEAPLYLTRAMFWPGEKFSSIVTHNGGLQGIRDRDPAKPLGPMSEFTSNTIARYGSTHPRFGDTELSVSYPFRAYVEGTIGIVLPEETGAADLAGGVTAATGSTGSTGATGSTGSVAAVIVPPPAGHVFVGNGTFSANIENSVLVPDIVDSGQLVGIKAATPLILPNFFPVVGSGPLRKVIVNAAVGFDANRHFGGGILGSQNFIANNANLIQGQLPQDVTLINRRLTNRIYEDLLCHQMPTLSAQDVAGEVDPKSSHPFQNGASCMQCHSGIDPLAYSYRNIMNFRTTLTRNDLGLAITGMYQVPVVPSANVFAASAPAGRLMYRRLLDGSLQKRNVNGIADIGAALATERDLYLCAAKKYYAFFTGVNVSLIRESEEPLEKFHQGEVSRLAETLRQTQDLEKMIAEIFASKSFQTRNSMTVEAQP